jgi:4-hydroxy-tetrahydrodipicolinate synthase
MAGVGFSLPLIERLLKDNPDIVVGIKDSSGDWKNTEALLRTFPDFEVFPGSETYLLDALRLGGAGCISATANVNVAMMHALLQMWQMPAADAVQQKITAVRAAIQKFPVIPANKAILARFQSTPEWATVRPPLSPLADGAKAQLFGSLESLQFGLFQTVAAA